MNPSAVSDSGRIRRSSSSSSSAKSAVEPRSSTCHGLGEVLRRRGRGRLADARTARAARRIDGRPRVAPRRPSRRAARVRRRRGRLAAGPATKTRRYASPRSRGRGAQLVERAPQRAQAPRRRATATGDHRGRRRSARRRRARCFGLFISPKSTWIGEPEYQIGARARRSAACGAGGRARRSARAAGTRPRRSRSPCRSAPRARRRRAAARHHAVRGDDVHGVVGEGVAQRRDHLRACARRRSRRSAPASWPMSCSVRMIAPLREERHEQRSHRVAGTAHDLDDAAIASDAGAQPDHRDAERARTADAPPRTAARCRGCPR